MAPTQALRCCRTFVDNRHNSESSLTLFIRLVFLSKDGKLRLGANARNEDMEIC